MPGSGAKLRPTPVHRVDVPTVGVRATVDVQLTPRTGRVVERKSVGLIPVPLRAVLDAMQRLSAIGISARAIQLRLIWPFPAQALLSELKRSQPSVMIECNYSGQLNTLLQQQTGRACDHLIVKYSGRPMSGEALYPALRAIQAGEAEARIVLRNSYE